MDGGRDSRQDFADAAERLADRALELCSRFLRNGYLDQRKYWRVGDIDGAAGQSLCVWLSGPKAGQWCDFNGRRWGDMLDLVARHACGGDRVRALHWARDFLGTERADPGALRTKRAAREREAARAEGRNRGGALRLFLAASPRLEGTATWRYLEGRAIDLARLGRQPRALRHHTGLVHPETGEICPAMVAAISDLDGTMVALHRTFLETLPDGRVVKLRGVKKAKLTLGTYPGAAIRIWRGASLKPLRQAVEGEEAVIGEGIEDCLQAALADPAYRVLCGVSSGNMAQLALPPAIGGVVLLGQNEDNDQARAGWAAVVAHFTGLGKRVRFAAPPVHVKDLNELGQWSASRGV